MSVLLLELAGAEIAESGMQALAIVPNLNVVKDCGTCECMGDKLVRHPFGFQRAKETFCNRIVVTVAHSAHAQLDIHVCQGAQVVSTGVLAALVRVMK